MLSQLLAIGLERGQKLLRNQVLNVPDVDMVFIIKLFRPFVCFSSNLILTLIRVAGGVYDFRNFEQV